MKMFYSIHDVPLASAGRLSIASRMTVAGSERTELTVRHTCTGPPFSGAVLSDEEKEMDMPEGRKKKQRYINT